MPYVGKKPADIIATAVDTTTGTFSGNLTVDTSTLYVDSANNRVGVGTTSPTVLLDLESTSPTIKFTDSDASGTPESEVSGAGGDLTLRADKDNEKASSIIGFEVDGTEAMRIDSSGNVGIGVVPEAWDSVFSALQVGGTGALRSDASADASDTVGVSQNAYYDSANSRWEYLVTDEASDYYQQSGSHYWRVAPSGSADSAITWANAMTIDNSGRLLLGTTTEGEAGADDLTIATTGHTGITIRTGTSGEGSLFFSDGTSGADEYRGYVQYLHSANALRFGTNAAERMRIDSSGRVGIGASNNGDYHANNDDLLIATSGSTGITIASGTIDQGRIAFADGTSDSADEIRGLLMYNHNGNSMSFFTNAAEAMRITSGGDLLVNTTTDTSGGFSIQTISSNTTATRMLAHGFSCRNNWGTASNLGNGIFSPAGGTLAFSTSSVERMRILSDGGLCINRTNQANSERLAITGNSSSQCMSLTSPITGDYDMVNLINGNGQVGRIGTNGSASQFVTSSDYRLKENVSYSFDATSRLKQLKPARFNFIADASTTVDGFLAHEVSSIVPEAISGTKDAVNEDGSINPQGIDQSKLVPLLVKTIQELEARIVALETA